MNGLFRITAIIIGVVFSYSAAPPDQHKATNWLSS
jgi:hypothetical protein